MKMGCRWEEGLSLLDLKAFFSSAGLGRAIVMLVAVPAALSCVFVLGVG